MNRSFCLAATLVAVAACSDNAKTSIDANIVVIADAALPDALVCTPLTDCMGVCVDTKIDQANCGACGMACTGGKSCVASACVCPPDFAPAMLAPGPGDMAPNLGVPGLVTWISLYNKASALNVAAVAFTAATVSIDQEYDLATITGTTTPIFGLGYKINLGTQRPESAFEATEGKLVFTKACAAGVSGTLTSAKFEAVEGLNNPTPVGGGCSFTVASLPFSIGKPQDCPAPQPL